MMDDSDGIALSLYDLMSVNDCGFLIVLQCPSRQVFRQHRHGSSLYGGGDYELIFTCPKEKTGSGIGKP